MTKSSSSCRFRQARPVEGDAVPAEFSGRPGRAGLSVPHRAGAQGGRLSCLFSYALAAILAFAAVPAPAEDDADYPDHVKDEIRAAKLEREARLIRLEFELQNLRDSVLDAKIRKFENARTLLQADQEMRVLLNEHPELYSLYRTALGQDAGPPPVLPAYEEPEIDYCGCMQTAEVLWLGRKEQAGQAVLALEGALYDVRVGGNLGDSLCFMVEADEKHATLECRNPVMNVVFRQDYAIKKFHRVDISEAVPENAR